MHMESDEFDTELYQDIQRINYVEQSLVTLGHDDARGPNTVPYGQIQ